MRSIQKKQKGSVLVFTLLVLSILLSVALTSVSVVITGKNSSRSTEKSALAFQIADGAAENVLKRVYRDTDATLSDLASRLYHETQDGAPICDNGTITGALPSASSGRYSVTFYDIDGNVLLCSGTGYDTYDEWRSKLVKVVASGSYAGATRAIDVPIKLSACGGVETVDYGGDTYDTIEVGGQCWLKQNMNIGVRVDEDVAQANNNIIEKSCYENSDANCTTAHPTEPDGGLYTWDEAMKHTNAQGLPGICPAGWYVPTDADWYELESHLDATVNNPNTTGWRGTTVGTDLKSGGTSGFEANLSGHIRSSGTSVERGVATYFWTSTVSGGGTSAFARYLNDTNTSSNRQTRVKTQRLSVRCIKA